MPRATETPVQNATPFETWYNSGSVVGQLPESTRQQIKWYLKQAWDAGVTHGEKKSASVKKPDSDSFSM